MRNKKKKKVQDIAVKYLTRLRTFIWLSYLGSSFQEKQLAYEKYEDKERRAARIHQKAYAIKREFYEFDNLSVGETCMQWF